MDFHARRKRNQKVFSMPNSKARGPDGFSASFFKSFWATVGADVLDVIQDFFSSGTMPRGLNHTFIALIPKGEGSSRLSQFRPISLCNVVYKAISKIMTNRKGCFQRLFPLIRVLGRKLHHQAILAQELVHVLKK